MMILCVERFDDILTFHGQIHNSDVKRLKLEPFDRAILGDDTQLASEVLVNLEIMFKRWENHEGGAT